MERPTASAPGRILVVDDDEMNRDMLSRRLARRGYDVTVAAGGEEALELVGTDPIDLVLLDIMMPGVDGLQVLETVRRDRSPSALPIIMATAKHTSEDVVHALRLGANDYVTKPLDFPVVLARVQTHLALKRATEELEAAHRRMKSDLDAAARVQRALIPTDLPSVEGVEFAWRYEPCDELAGDILDLFRLDDGGIGLYLLDVSGHGVPAALLSVAVNRVLSHLDEESLLFEASAQGGSRPRSPAHVASRLNARFPMDPATRQYFTIVYGLIDPEATNLRYVAAAHPGPLQVAADGSWTQHPPTGLAIGWFPVASYEEHAVELAPGDRIFFFSDGIVEAAAEDGEELGLDRIGAALADGRSGDLDASLDLLLDRLARWTGEAGVADDVSVLALEVG